jgi:amino acid permease
VLFSLHASAFSATRMKERQVVVKEMTITNNLSVKSSMRPITVILTATLCYLVMLGMDSSVFGSHQHEHRSIAEQFLHLSLGPVVKVYLPTSRSPLEDRCGILDFETSEHDQHGPG